MSRLDDAFILIEELSPLEKLKLIEKLSVSLEQNVRPQKPRKSLYGIWKGVSISAEEIDEARQEMWGNFPREDI